MGNLKLTLPPAQTLRSFKSQVQKGGTCQNITQQVTEIGPPLECVAGDRVILFLKVPALTRDGSGVIVASLITRVLNCGNYEYWLQYADSLLVDGVSIDQCDIRKSCCYGCDVEFLCLLIAHPDCEVIQDCVGAAMHAEDGLNYDDDANRFEVAISEEDGNQIIKKTDGIYAATAVAGEIDDTLRRDDGGILGVSDTAEPAGGHSFLFGFDSSGAGVRIPKIAAKAVMSGASTSWNVPFASQTNVLADFDQVDYDPFTMITPGAGWNCTVPISDRYYIGASILYNNTAWGGFGASGLAGVSLYIKKNSDPEVLISTSTVYDRSMGPLSTAQVIGSTILNLAAGDQIQILTSHGDNNMPANTHAMIGTDRTHFEIFRIP